MTKKIAVCLAALVLLAVGQGMQALLLLPAEVTRFEGEQSWGQDLPWAVKLVGEERGEEGGGSLNAAKAGCYRLSYSLLGLLPLRQVEVTVIPRLELIPSGHSIGVKLAESGVIVAGLDSIMTGAGRAEPAKDSGFKAGDVLLAVNGIELKSLGQAAAALEDLCQEGVKLDCLVVRGTERLTLSVTPIFDVELKRPRLGLLLKDTAAGVGTMTFYHEKTGYFGALGHMITDENGGKAADLRAGRIVEASIVSIRRGQQGKPGEKQGVFGENSQPLGVIKSNTELGIFGLLARKPTAEIPPLPLGLKDQVKVGKAEILTVIEGDKVESFAIEIEKLFVQNQPACKGMVIKITDPKLLAATGGIVQGMSGSPIIQGGKIVGAVTHVFINEPKRGYACFAEWMVIKSGLLSEIESFSPPRLLEAVFFFCFSK